MNLSTRFLIAPCLALAVAYALPAAASPIVLYNDNDTQNPLPTDQGWLFYLADNGGTASQIPVAAGTQLTTDEGVSAGYSNYGSPNQPSFPELDRNLGFRLNFELEMVTENHTSDHRAGFSVILLSSDNMGIELGFWDDEVWAQNDSPLFTHGEGSTGFSPQGQEYAYQLTILGNGYALSADGNEVLNGSLRNYAAAGAIFPPYTLPNYLFLGDDTTSGAASSVLGEVSIEVFPAAVPLPSGLWLVSLGLVLLLARRLVTAKRRQ